MAPLQVTCPACTESYFVDVEKIPWDGGQLTCPSCSASWEIYRPASDRRAAPRPVTGERTASTPSPTKKEDAKVSCPKCGHHFLPGTAAPPGKRKEDDSRKAASPAGSKGTGGPGEPSGPSGGSAGPRGGPADRKVVLLVEDQTYFTELAREALGAIYRTITVATKDEALTVISKGLPDLLILDLSLARGQDGRDLLRAMPEKRFPVLIFTARDESELYGDAWAELQALGADDIVRKTMNVGEELRRKVGEMLA